MQGGGAKRQRRQSTTGASRTTASFAGQGQRRRRRQVPSSQQKVLERDDLLTEILTKLPTAKALIRCTAVSKQWYKIVNHPYTISRWKPSRNPAAIFFTRYATDSEDVMNFTHIPLLGVAGETGERPKRRTQILTDDANITMNIDHSCNGLLICSTDTSFVLYNPTTKRGTRFSGPMKGGVISIMNLAFDPPSVYKIVAVCRSRNNADQIKYSIQVLEPDISKAWRNTGVEFPNLEATERFIYPYGVYMSGAIYWPDQVARDLMYFNVGEEKLVWLPNVPNPDDSHTPIVYFGECRGRLRMVKYGSMRGAAFDMLELKDDHSTWYVKYHVDLSPRLRLATMPGVHFPLHVLAILPGDGDGEEDKAGESHIILHIPGQVVSYNFKDRTLQRVCDLSLRTTERDGMSFHPYSFVHSYSETLFRPPCKLTASS